MRIAEPYNKWRIVFNHSTDADGEVVLPSRRSTVSPVDVTTQIPKGTTENQAAQLVKKSLKTTLGKGYKVEVDDFETVVIKKAGKTPKFDVTLASSTVSGLSIDLKRCRCGPRKISADRSVRRISRCSRRRPCRRRSPRCGRMPCSTASPGCAYAATKLTEEVVVQGPVRVPVEFGGEVV